MARRVTYTVTAGSNPFCVSTGTTSAAGAGFAPVWASRIFIQMLVGGSGYGKVYDGVVQGNAPVAGNLVAELAPASASAPGGAFDDWDKGLDRGGIDVNEMWVTSSNATDTIVISYVPKG